MPDEPLAPVETDTPAVENADSIGTPAPAEDYESRYKELQSTYTRTSQENAQYRQLVEALADPERAPEALSALGYEIAQQEAEDPGYQDPVLSEVEQLKKQLSEVTQWRDQQAQAQQQAAQQAAEQAYFETQFETLAADAGRDLNQAEVAHIVAYAKANPDSEGKPNVRAGWESLNSLYESEFNNRVEAKKRAPRAPAGQPGAAVPDTSTREGRLHAALERMQALEQ